jgi:hypothetical protein
MVDIPTVANSGLGASPPVISADSDDVELPLRVMAGLVSAVHAFLAQSPKEDVDARDKRGHDDGER